MSYSALLVSNTAANVITAGSIVPLGSAIHGFGKAIRLNGNNINLTDTGYYRVTVSASAAITGTAAASLQLNADGVAIPGAISTVTPAAAAAIVNYNIVWLIRKSCCCDPTSLTVTISAAATMSNISVEVEKV